MHPYPHHYRVSATGAASGDVVISSPSLPDLATQPPPQFGGPEGMWSPETLLCAAVADCFQLTFRSLARHARFEWTQLSCKVEGTLERVDGVSRFTRFATTAELAVPEGADQAKAQDLLERAEHGCLISNSLSAARTLEAKIIAMAPSSGVAIVR